MSHVRHGHWEMPGVKDTGPPHTFLCNFLWIYNYLKIKFSKNKLPKDDDAQLSRIQ